MVAVEVVGVLLAGRGRAGDGTNGMEAGLVLEALGGGADRAESDDGAEDEEGEGGEEEESHGVVVVSALVPEGGGAHGQPDRRPPGF